MNDNRNYKYVINSTSKRAEFGVIAKLVKKGSSVVDLGMGDGTLLKILKDRKGVKGLGIEISPSGVRAAKKKGVESRIGRIDVKLPFKNKEFDYAICNVTLQMVMYPEILIREMARISQIQIITFPNFGYVMNRLEMLFKGRMPNFMLGGYRWFSTGLIHQLSIKDFTDFCKDNEIKIVSTSHIFPERLFVLPKIILKMFPNLFAGVGIFITSGK